MQSEKSANTSQDLRFSFTVHHQSQTNPNTPKIFASYYAIREKGEHFRRSPILIHGTSSTQTNPNTPKIFASYYAIRKRREHFRRSPILTLLSQYIANAPKDLLLHATIPTGNLIHLSKNTCNWSCPAY